MKVSCTKPADVVRREERQVVGVFLANDLFLADAGALDVGQLLTQNTSRRPTVRKKDGGRLAQ